MIKGTLRERPNRTGGPSRFYLDLRDGSKWIACPDDVAAKGKPAAVAWRDRFVASMTKLGASEQLPRTGHDTCAVWFKRYYDAAEKGTVGRKNRGKPDACKKPM